jgi:hypothetical protein
MSGTINDSSTGGFVTDIPPPPPTGEQITAALQTMIATLGGLPGTLVRPRWQPMPPAQPPAGTTWAAVGITRAEADNYPFILHDGATQIVGASGPGADRMQRHSTITVLVTFYGPEAERAAGAMRDGLYVQQNWEPLAAVGLKFRDIRDLARLPELVNQQWIDRFDVQIDFRHQIDRTYPILNLDGADVVIRTDTGAADIDVSVRPDTVLRP